MFNSTVKMWVYEEEVQTVEGGNGNGNGSGSGSGSSSGGSGSNGVMMEKLTAGEPLFV